MQELPEFGLSCLLKHLKLKNLLKTSLTWIFALDFIMK